MHKGTSIVTLLKRWRPAAPVFMLFVLSVGAVFGLTYVGGIGLDKEAALNSRSEILVQLAGRLRGLESAAREYAWWDAAYENLAIRFSMDWARANLAGETITNDYSGLTGSLVVGANGRLLCGFSRHRELGADFVASLDGGLDLLVAQARDARNGSGAPVPVHGILRHGDHILLAAAAVITPFQYPGVRLDPDAAPVFIIFKALNEKNLQALAAATMAADLRTSSTVAASDIGLPLIGIDGNILGYLTWSPPQPGKRLIDHLMIPIALVTLLLAALFVAAMDQILRARRAAESYAEMVADKNKRLEQATDLMSVTVDSIDEGIVMIGNDGRIRYWNKTYERMWHLPVGLVKVGKPLEEVIAWKMGTGGYELVETEIGEEDERPASTTTTTTTTIAPLCQRLYRGREGRLIEARRFLMPDGQGQIGVTRDLTETKAREKALIEASEQADIANRAKSEFLANVSHELRTPLNTVIGFSEVLEVELYGPIDNDKYRSYIRDIRASGRHLLDLINGILEFSKIEAGKLELRLEATDCTMVTQDAARQLSHQAAKQGIRFNVDIPPLPVLISADRRHIFQALVNLLSNAVKFTPRGGTVTLAYRVVQEGWIAFVVSDTGIGIADADIPHVLEPFSQIDSELARRHRGTGLGLSIVKGICDLHGGRLDIESELGVGTTIVMTIPDQRQRDARPAIPAPGPASAPASAPTSRFKAFESLKGK
jgi:signal transduction histidine kinase/sensor domain CHASE-containing protein